MVKEIIKGKRKYFRCEECGMIYKKEEWAEKCEDWCAHYHTCNIEITRHAEKEDKYHGKRSDLRNGG